MCCLSKPSVVGLGFHMSTFVFVIYIYIYMYIYIYIYICLIAWDIFVLAQASLGGCLSLINKDFHYCCVFGV